MNIFLLTETSSGCYKWRGAIPAKYLRRRGHQVQVFSMTGSSHYTAPDVMVFYRAHFQEGEKMMAWCRRNGIRVVFDTDDALHLVPPENPHHIVIRPRIQLYESLLRTADVVTTTTATLAAHLRGFNKNVVVIPNSVDPEEWPAHPVRESAAPLRVGWTGSPTHYADLAAALDAVHVLQKKRDFLLVLQGLGKENTLDELYKGMLAVGGKRLFETAFGRSVKHFLAKMSGLRYEFHPVVPLEQHAGKVAELALDIGIAPLLDNEFNRNKSCIKYYEYAMSGAVTVASHVLPYSEEVPVTARNKREAWIQALERVLDGDRAAMLAEQREWVLTHRNIETKVAMWERVLAGDPVAAEAPSPALEEALV